jgi:hypothetical protein
LRIMAAHQDAPYSAVLGNAVVLIPCTRRARPIRRTSKAHFAAPPCPTRVGRISIRRLHGSALADRFLHPLANKSRVGRLAGRRLRRLRIMAAHQDASYSAVLGDASRCDLQRGACRCPESRIPNPETQKARQVPGLVR